MKVNFPTHVCLRRSWQLFLILTLWSYSKYKDILHTLNVYKIPVKDYKIVDRWTAGEVYCFGNI